ncbi:hypothetical protein BGX29_011140 [Mortierella sp. GBA35]|nr:hypothetical protein BGX29_011140 [Mortierella sp. GBA35]
MTTLAPSVLDQLQEEEEEEGNIGSLVTPARSPSRIKKRRVYSAARDLNLSGFFSSSASSLSSDQAEEGMESPLTASSMMTSPTQSTASRLPSFESAPVQTLAPAPVQILTPAPVQTLAPAQITLAPSPFLLSPTSPCSTISPTSPLKIAFSSPRNHRSDPTNASTTFASFHNQLSPGSKQSYIAQLQKRQSGQCESRERPQYQDQDRGRSLVSLQVYTSPNYQPRSHLNHDPKKDDSSLIPIHVRYVPKDLWVQVDLPRDMPVHKARDLILSKCRLTSIPLQASSDLSLATDHRADTIPLGLHTRDPSHSSGTGTNLLDAQWHPRESSSTSTFALHSDGTSTAASSPSPYRNRRSSRSGQDDDNFNDQESIDDDEAELRAEELMGSDMFSQSAPSRVGVSGGLVDSFIQSTQGIPFVSSCVRHNSHGSHNGDPVLVQPSLSPRLNVEQPQQQQQALSQQQLNRLITYSTLHKKDSHRSAHGRDRHSREGSSTTKRFSNIPGWSHYRSRQSSNSSKHIDREVLDHGGILADHFLDEDSPSMTGARKSECTAWKACFGLFWLAAGHWLDDSRLVSSYSLQPHCLLELQLRNSYIQLPPPGTALNYYDHYAEGLLYKKSKKNKLGQGNKECAGVWKERWVVLQGNKLFIYHKRKDKTKKSLELTVPLTVTAIAVPQSSRNSFKLTSSSAAMSSNMITLTTAQNPTVPKVCFRASSESELNHWIRIFNSLNSNTVQGLPPPLDPHVMVPSIAVPPPLPPLPSLPPPVSMDRSAMSTTRHHRHHSHSATYHRTVIEGVYHSERKRGHTSQSASTMPSIDPILISNAAAALSNLHQGSSGSDSNSGSESDGGDGLGHGQQHHYTIAELKYFHNRSSCSSSSSTTGSRGLHQLERQTLSRNGSLSSYRNSFQSRPGGSARHRTLTEPGHLIRVRSMGSQRSSLQILRDQIRRSKDLATESSSGSLSVAGQTSKALGDVTLLEPPVQALLKSAGTVLYSGYIWLYIPNGGVPSRRDDQGSLDILQDSRRVLMAPPMSRTSSMSSVPTTTLGGRAANICISKASGRYVKCFAVINDKGQFQWTEVKKQEDVDGQSQDDYQSESQAAHPTFGFPLTSSRTQGEGTGGTGGTGSSSDEDIGLNSSSSALGTKAERTVQASMAHKLRLFFFCIRISTSSAGDIKVEMLESPSSVPRPVSTPPGSSPARTQKSPLRETNCLSDQPRTRMASSPLPPVPAGGFPTKTHARSGSMAPSFGRFDLLNQPVWPSMSPLHERTLPPTPAPTLPLVEKVIISKTISTPPPAATQASLTKNLFLRTPSLFVENRTRSAPPGSIFPTAASLSRFSSYSGLLRNVILAASAEITPEQVRHKHCPYSQTGTPEGTMVMTPESVPSSIAMSPPSTSNVLSLAEELQKALQRRQEPSDGCGDNNRESLNPLGSPLLSPPTRQITKPTLSEITSKKRASIQQQQESLNIALNVERSRLKLIGVLNTLEEGCEIEEVANSSSMQAKAKAREEERMKQEKASRTAAAAAMLRMLLQCPFLEQSETKDTEGRTFLSLKGYTETETGWKALQSTLERFLDGPIKDQRSALPPEDTLIPSYHAPKVPEMRLSEKAQNFLKAKDRVAAAAVAAAAAAAAAATITDDRSRSSAKPTITALVSSSTAVLTRSGSLGHGYGPVAAASPGRFHRHSVHLTSGTGCGPDKSFGYELGAPGPMIVSSQR